ncbi:MAG: bifunctional DNA-formamidopyrimidine glycosylase/DNA-(apurinic or apyrimidinic site) lyase [Aggregatilineales bacterium]
MPELPEVEMVVRGLRDDMVGRTFLNMRAEWAPQLGDTTPDAFAARLSGQKVEALWRRGKYVIFELTDDYLIIHLKMTGRLYVAREGEVYDADRFLRVVFGLDNGYELRFSDVRKFGRLYLVSDVEGVVGKLGPEPLDGDFTLEAFRARLGNRTRNIKALLLDQSFIAGVGNIYADEALWLAGIAPQRKADTLTAEEQERLYHAVRSVLNEGIAREGSSISWYRKPDGSAGSYQNFFKVYGREDEPCPRCGTPVLKLWIAQRGTHYCPHCQT